MKICLDGLFELMSVNHSARYGGIIGIFFSIFSSPGQSPGRAIALPPASALASASALAAALALANVKVFMLKFFYVMGKALSGELSCPCDRSCCSTCFHLL